jgi:hypothetical protein
MVIAYRIHSASRTPLMRFYAQLLRRGKQRYAPIGYGGSRCDENDAAGLRRPEPGWRSDYATSRPSRRSSCCLAIWRTHPARVALYVSVLIGYATWA